MSMQEKGRKHGADWQNFYESGRETLAPACGHGRRRPYTNVVPWKGAHRAAQTVGFRNRFGRGPPKGTGRRGIFLAVLLGVIGACGRCLSLELSGEPSACGIFRAAGNTGKSGGRLRMLRAWCGTFVLVPWPGLMGKMHGSVFCPAPRDFPVRAVEIFALRVHFAWTVLKIVLLSCCKERLFLWCRLK